MGGWVRPISPSGKEGSLSDQERTLTNGSSVALKTFADIHVLRNENKQFQPENWVLDDRRPWSLPQFRMSPPSLNQAIETPLDLWLQPDSDQQTDRISHSYLTQHPPAQSLYLVRPQQIRLNFFTNQQGKAKKRVLFTYNDCDYDLALTDPEAISRYCPQEFPAQDQPAMDKILDPAVTLLCVSLADKWKDDNHYKLVAAVIEER